MIDKSQYDTIKGTSTTHALIMMLHEWLHGMDVSRKKNLVHIVLLDNSKGI